MRVSLPRFVDFQGDVEMVKRQLGEWARDALAVWRAIPAFEVRDVTFTEGTVDDGILVRTEGKTRPYVVLGPQIVDAKYPSPGATLPSYVIWSWEPDVATGDGAIRIGAAVVSGSLIAGDQYTIRLLIVSPREG